jgi:hypothetical protein
MRRTLLFLLGLVGAVGTLAAAKTGLTILLVARDLHSQRISGVRFTFQEVKTGLTNQQGEAELNLPLGDDPGKQIRVSLVPSSTKSNDWFLVDPAINVPDTASPAEVVLMQRSELRQIAAEVRDTTHAPSRPGEFSDEDRERILIEAAARRGLTEPQLESAIRSFGETQDPKDRGIAAFLARLPHFYV